MKWLTALLLALAALLGGLLVYRTVAPRPLRGGTALDQPLKVPALPLLDDQGRPTTLSASSGRMRLVFFGYTRCPDVCPLTMIHLTDLYTTLPPEQQKHVQVQFITVDPENDTPRLLRDYLNKFSPRFTGLTGQATVIDQAAKALYVANVRPALTSQSADGHGGMNHGAAQSGNAGGMNHSGMSGQDSAPPAGLIHGDEVRVITPAGEFVRVYTNQETLDGTLQKDLPGLIRAYGS